ncbi:MAG: zinc ABC transporter substrate-binding protein [Oscillospiraceae bacterium]|nr:zinc ABC transporter substrate-binding protein [Oscillospiraceae bacterium]
MKKITPLFLGMALLLTSCDISSGKSGDSDKLSIVTTIFPPYDFVREIADDNVEITMLLEPGSESHSYEPTPQDIIKIQESDLFIYVGGEGDVWVDTILDSMNKPLNTIVLMDEVEAVTEEIVEGMEHEHEHEHDENCDHDHSEEAELDEHVWTSPENAIKIVESIRDELCSIDEENSGTYKTNADAYLKELNALNDNIKEIVKTGKRDTVVFGDRFPMRYFADCYDISYYAAFPGCSTDSEPSASTIAFLIDKVKEENIPVIFSIEFSNQKVAKTISEATGAKIYEFHSCHNVTSDDFKNGASYLSLMTRNAEVLKEALN